MQATIHLPQHDRQMVLDPNMKYPDADPVKILRALGFLPEFFDQAREETFIEDVLRIYGYNMGAFEGFTVNIADGTMSYPDDDDLHPLAKIKVHPDLEVYVYQHAWVTFVGSCAVLTYRMD